MQNAATTEGDGLPLYIQGTNTAVITITITGTAVITFEVQQVVNGNWTAVQAVNLSTAESNSTAGTSGAYRIYTSAIYALRARISSYTSGEVTAVGTAATTESDDFDTAGITAALAGKMDKDTDGTPGNLIVLDANGNAVDAGYAADTAATAGSVVRRGLDNLVQVEDLLVASQISITGAAELEGGTAVLTDGEIDGYWQFIGHNAAANRAAQLTELGAGATGAAILATTTQDEARAVLGLEAVAIPPLIRNHNNMTWSAINVVGGASNSNYLNAYLLMQTSATANSSGSLRVGDNAVAYNYTNAGVHFARRINLSIFVRNDTANAEGVAYWTIGKITAGTYGLIAFGNYIGFRVENQTVTGLVYCVANTVSIINVSVAIPTALLLYITSNNGTVTWYANGVSIGSTSSGPTANTPGTLFAEIQNGATAANYSLTFISSSEGY